MGVLQRFERRLERLVEGSFARVFKGVVEPVEVASALQREAADRKAILGPGRTLVPNRYVVELGATDFERLSPYEGPLTDELAAMVREHVTEQQWTTFGAVEVALAEVDDLDTGRFRVSSAVDADPGAGRQPPVPGGTPENPSAPAPVPVPAVPAAPVSKSVTARLSDGDRDHPLAVGITVLGRGQEADVRLPDTGVSRRHAQVRFDGVAATVLDLGSTNGTKVNDRLVDRAQLRHGDRVTLGTTTLVYRQDG